MLTIESLSPNQVMDIKRELFFQLIDFFNQNNIRYCILGNVDTVPDEIDSDLDIAIAESDFKCVLNGLLTFENLYSAKSVQILRHEITGYYIVLAYYKNEQYFPFYIHVDICTDYLRNARLLLTADELIANRDLSTKQFYIPSVSVAFIYYLLKRIDKADLQQGHFNYLLMQYEKSRSECKKYIYQFWSSENASELIRIFESAKFQTFSSSYEKLKLDLYQKRKLKLRTMISDGYRKLQRFLYPSGLSIAFLGPDGSGKSTVAEILLQYLIPAFRRSESFHLRPRLAMKKNINVVVETNPHGKNVYNIFLSLAKLCYLLADYCLGYYFIITTKLVCSTLVMFDRYFVDVIVDPKRFRLSTPVVFSKIIEKLIPNPDFYFLLLASAKTIQNRKQEVSLAETERQLAAYSSWSNARKKVTVLNAEKSSESLALEALQNVLNAMARRTQERFYAD